VEEALFNAPTDVTENPRPEEPVTFSEEEVRKQKRRRRRRRRRRSSSNDGGGGAILLVSTILLGAITRPTTKPCEHREARRITKPITAR